MHTHVLKQLFFSERLLCLGIFIWHLYWPFITLFWHLPVEQRVTAVSKFFHLKHAKVLLDPAIVRAFVVFDLLGVLQKLTKLIYRGWSGEWIGYWVALCKVFLLQFTFSLLRCWNISQARWLR